MYHFSYKCKCLKHIYVIDRFHQLQKRLLLEYDVVIHNWEARATICDGAFEMHISLDLQLNTSEQEAVFMNELQALVFYLDANS